MSEVLNSIKEFLDSIPEFLGNLEPGNEYLAVTGAPEGVWKALKPYTVEENETGDGFNVIGRLAVPLTDLILRCPGWVEYKSHYPNIMDNKLYEQFLTDNPNFISTFNLEEFCKIFEEFYSEFLNDAGISESDIILSGNSIKLNTGSTVVPIDVNEEDAVNDSSEDSTETGSVDYVSGS